MEERAELVSQGRLRVAFQPWVPLAVWPPAFLQWVACPVVHQEAPLVFQVQQLLEVPPELAATPIWQALVWKMGI
ncbi:MAG: hypothetical protein EBS30_19610 [Planctomycetes bacterium]|nr:hypothetical protein [Planctomycetota bacterium]